MAHVIDRPARRIRHTKGASSLTHGSDNYDHRGYNKAQRAMGKALIEEALIETIEAPPEPEYRWVLEAWLIDGDKPWLDGWQVVGVFETAQELDEKIATINELSDTELSWEYREVEEWEL